MVGREGLIRHRTEVGHLLFGHQLQCPHQFQRTFLGGHRSAGVLYIGRHGLRTGERVEDVVDRLVGEAVVRRHLLLARLADVLVDGLQVESVRGEPLPLRVRPIVVIVDVTTLVGDGHRGRQHRVHHTVLVRIQRVWPFLTGQRTGDETLVIELTIVDQLIYFRVRHRVEVAAQDGRVVRRHGRAGRTSVRQLVHPGEKYHELSELDVAAARVEQEVGVGDTQTEGGFDDGGQEKQQGDVVAVEHADGACRVLDGLAASQLELVHLEEGGATVHQTTRAFLELTTVACKRSLIEYETLL